MAENKTKPTKLSVAAFIAALTDPIRKRDAKALVKLMRDATAKAADVGTIHPSSASETITTATTAGVRTTCLLSGFRRVRPLADWRCRFNVPL
jgi:hypothetical protein